VLFILLSLVNRAFSQAPNISYASPQNYSIGRSISPLLPTNTGGAVPATIYGQVSTIARNFNTTTGVAVDAVGNVYVEDYGNHQIKKVTPAGVVTVFAGSGASGFTNGQGSAATLNNPDGITIDGSGNLYIGDQSNHSIRKITPGGLVTTLAGNGNIGSADGTGPTASFYYPKGLGVDATGNIYVADNSNNLIRKVTPAGVVTTIAGNGNTGFTNGNGRSASFNSPTGVEADAAGNLYIADAGNNAIRKMTPAGVVTTFATGINFPREIRVDAGGTFYVTSQSSNLIKKISSTGIMTTLAGNGSAGSTDGNINTATFNQPIGLALDGAGNLYVGDAYNNSVRKITVTGYTIDKALPSGLTFNSATGVISGTPTVLSPATDYTVTAYNVAGASSTVVNIQVLAAGSLIPSVINFPLPVVTNIDDDNILRPGITSNNNETPITYTSSNPAVAYIGTDGLIHVIAPGITIITASQSGNSNYTAAVPVSRTYTIKQDQLLVFPAFTTKLICSADFNAGVMASNAVIPITYTSSNATVATINAQGLIHITGAGTTTITANQSGNNLFNEAAPQSQLLTVNLPAPPLVSITANTTSACQGSSLTLTATVRNSITTDLFYQWKINGLSTGSNSSILTVASASQTDNFECEVTNNASCMAKATSNTLTGLSIVPYITPGITISTSVNTPVCSGTLIVFTAAVVNEGINSTYQWKVNNINTGTNQPNLSINTLTNNDVVTCMITNNSGMCLASSTSTSNAIIVSLITPTTPAPTVTIQASANNVYEGTTIVFRATPANAGIILDYQWRVNDMVTGANSNVFTSNKLKNDDVVTCVITSNIACSTPVTSAAIKMKLLPSLILNIPNTFTPNGDGVNDYWDITAELASYPGCVVSVYNRSGILVYQSRGYNKAWDGNYNGQALPTTTYYYTIELSGKKQPLSGSITIIR
jgi:gliding motility-associated-like protein